jgi:Protein of unknown function (DUF1569)
LKTLGAGDVRVGVIARVRSLRPDSVRRFGRMSVSEMMVHCTDCLAFGVRQRDVSAATGGALSRRIVKYVALYAPMRWPTGLPTRPEVDPERDGSRPGGFEADVVQLIAMVERFGDQQTAWPVHPIFGPLSEWQWHRWGYLHTDHHLRQFSA